MKKILSIAFISFFSLIFLCVFGREQTREQTRGQNQGQSNAGKPLWLDSYTRSNKYPQSTFITGFADYIVEKGKSVQTAIDAAKLKAQENLAKSIRIQINSVTQSGIDTRSNNGNYSETETFSSTATAKADAEITGITTESYFDQSSNTVYAFAYANRYELIGYYKGNLAMYFTQAETSLKTAEQLEQSGEKAKARKQCEETLPLFAKIRSAQNLLAALDNSTTPSSLKTAETEQLLSKATQMQARLTQAILVFVSGSEILFGRNENAIANKVKSHLAQNDCSFTDEMEQADFILKINADVRLSSTNNGFVVCYADVEVELYDRHKRKVVYGDEFSQKGVSGTQEEAGRKAMREAANIVVEKLSIILN